MTRSRYGTGSITLERGRYRIRIPDGRGGHLSVGTRATRAEAEALLAAALDEATGLALVGVSLQAYGERVIERWARAGQRSVAADRARWSSIVSRAPFAAGAIDAITRRDVRDWARTLPSQRATRAVMRGGRVVERIELERPLSWQSCRHALGLLGRVLREAVEDGLLTDSPARDVRLPRRQERQEGWTWLRQPELQAVLDLPTLTLEQRTAITLAVYQGLRQGELAALRWEDVDLEAGWLVVRSSWGSSTKSGRVRRIPLLAPASAALMAWRPDPRRRTGLVLPAPGRGVYARGYDWGWGDRRAAGGDIPSRAGIGRRVRWHDLRHTCAAHLVSGSWGPAWTLREVGELLGHTEERVTARYAHLCPDALQRVARATATAATPAAHLPREPAAEGTRKRGKRPKSQAAGGMRFERMTFGSGGHVETSDSAGLGAVVAGLRQVIAQALEAIAAGEVRRAVDLLERGLSVGIPAPRAARRRVS